MSNLRIWTTLTPAEREAAIEQAKAIIAGGETRWHVVARLCGIKGGIPLRTALDEGWRARKREIDRKRSQGRCRAGLNRDDGLLASRERGLRTMMLRSNLAQYTPAAITLPKLKFMEETTNG